MRKLRRQGNLAQPQKPLCGMLRGCECLVNRDTRFFSREKSIDHRVQTFCSLHAFASRAR